MLSRVRNCAVVAAIMSLSACSGSSQTGHVGPIPQTGQSKTVKATFSIAIPKHRAKVFDRRSPDFISSSIQSAKLVVTPNGATAEPAVDFNCSSACTTTVEVPIGTDTFAVSVYDAPNQEGNLLASGSTTQQINVNQQNNVTVTFNPVVASASLSVTSTFSENGQGTNLPYLPIDGSAVTASLTVTAYDKDQNVIVGPGAYLNASQQPLTLTIVDSDTSGRTTLSPSTVTGGDIGGSGQSNAITVTYSGAVPRSVWPTFSLSAPGYANSVLGTPVTLQYGPTASASYSVLTPALGRSANWWYLSAGPSNTIWYANQTSQSVPEGIIGKLTIATGAISEYPLPNGDYYPVALTQGPDGNMWFTEVGYDNQNTMYVSKIAKITPAGSVTEYPVSGVPIQGSLVAGADGNLWFAEITTNTNTQVQAGVIGKVTPAGALTEYPLPNGQVFDNPSVQHAGGPILINGPSDGKIWFSYAINGVGKFGNISTATGTISSLTPSVSLADIYALVLGADGNFWFNGSSNISRTTGTVTTYNCLDSNTNFIGADSLIWGDESGEVTTINPTTHACRDEGYDENETSAPALSGGYPLLGPDNNFWTYDGTTIGKWLY